MRWEDGRESSNVDDVRGEGPQGGGGGGFGGGGLGGLLGLLPLLLQGGPIGIVILVVIGLIFFGGPLLGSLTGGGERQRAPSGYQGQTGEARRAAPASDPDIRFVRVVAGMTEDTWTTIFQEQGRTYAAPRFTVYTRGRKTACGYGQAEMGPFYCPGDRRVYLDLSFFGELSGKFGAPGRFAQAYVIAHEVGHHVQNLLGDIDRGERVGIGGSKNQTSVRTELQADCYAGVWAIRTNQAKNILEPGDLESGLRAASAVGDDTLQRQAQGRVVPDSFTHGSADQRVRWFRAGYDTGDMRRCDTFSPGYGEL